MTGVVWAVRPRLRTVVVLGLLLVMVACSFPDRPQPSPTASRDAALLVRVTVPTDGGVFALDDEALAPLGWSPATPLTLTRDGERWPLVRTDQRLLFYAPPRHNPYSTEQTLWLEPGTETTTVPALDTVPPDPTTTVLSTQTLEENRLYQPQSDSTPWFWQKLVAPADASFTLDLPDRAAGPIDVTVHVRGVTAGEHHLTLRLDGTTLLEERWTGHDDDVSIQATAEEPPDGSLELTLHMPQAGDGVDIILLDKIDVRYTRHARAVDDLLRLAAREDGGIAVENVGGPAVVWRATDASADPVPAANQDGRAVFDTDAGETYVVAGPRAGVAPDLARADAARALATAQLDADYLVVAPAEFHAALAPLIEARRDDGLASFVVTPREIYDAFSHGQVDPLAIRSFLRHARETWPAEPRFVLLVGDASYDPFGYLGEPTPNVIPSPFVDTVFGGQTVSDNLLADLDDDGYPDVALGRIPAATVEQVERVVEKTLTYRQEGAEEWRRRVVFVADDQESRFRTSSERLHDAVPSGMEAVPFYPTTGETDVAGMQTVLNEGALLVNYIGHGSVNRWGKTGLLTSEGASALNNGARLPIYVNMTCLTGLFTHPQERSLAESLLWAENGGAVAVLAPTSLTLPDDQTRLNQALLEAVFTDEGATIGEAIVAAKRTVALDTQNARDVVATFNLLGDPALRPAVP